MKLSQIVAGCALAGSLVGSAFAQDAREALHQATEALKAAPASRVTVVGTDPNTKTTDTVILEVVQPNLVHMRKDVGGRLQTEVVSDGSKTFMRRKEEDKFEPAPAMIANILNAARQKTGLDAVMQMAKDIKLAGHEDVKGVPASIYTFDIDMMGLHGTTKTWIADKDHRPLKSEGSTRGELTTGSGPGTRMDRDSVTTYEYDPSIKVTLPAS